MKNVMHATVMHWMGGDCIQREGKCLGVWFPGCCNNECYPVLSLLLPLLQAAGSAGLTGAPGSAGRFTAVTGPAEKMAGLEDGSFDAVIITHVS